MSSQTPCPSDITALHREGAEPPAVRGRCFGMGAVGNLIKIGMVLPLYSRLAISLQ